MKNCVHVSYYVGEFFLGGERFQRKVAEKIKTNFLCSINFFYEDCIVYELMRKMENMVELDISQIRRMRFHAG